jgi:hypothetical protein
VQHSALKRVTRRPDGFQGGQLRNVYSGKCLTPAGGSVGQNAGIVQYTCDGHLSRYWWFE